MQLPKPGRLYCLVPFCRCSVQADKFPGVTQVICAKHWRLVHRDLKARYRQLKRRRAKVWRWTYGPKVNRPNPGLFALIDGALDRHWERCKADAIERSAGI